VICVGGSSTFGDGLSRDEETYPWQLERLLAARFPDVQIEVLNAGCRRTRRTRGCGCSSAASSPRPGPRDHGLRNNDALHVIFGLPDAEYGKRLEAEARDGPTLVRRLGGLLRRSLLVNGLIANIPARDSKMPRVSPAEYRENLRGARARPRARLRAFDPHRARDGLHVGTPYLKPYYDAGASLAAETGAAAADPGPLLRQHASDALFLDFIHPTARGNALIAARLRDDHRARATRRGDRARPGRTADRRGSGPAPAATFPLTVRGAAP